MRRGDLVEEDYWFICLILLWSSRGDWAGGYCAPRRGLVLTQYPPFYASKITDALARVHRLGHGLRWLSVAIGDIGL